MKKALSQLVVAGVCVILGFLLTYQFKQLSVTNSGNIDYDSADILSEIEILKKEKEDLQKNNEILSEELKKLEDAAAKEGEVEEEIKKLKEMIGNEPKYVEPNKTVQTVDEQRELHNVDVKSTAKGTSK